MVNDSSRVEPGKEKQTSDNADDADDAASSASLGVYLPFCWLSCAAWPVLQSKLFLAQTLSVLMIFLAGAWKTRKKH